MDTPSSSKDQFINDAPLPRKVLLYQSLLTELHNLTMNHEASFRCGGIYGSWRPGFQLPTYFQHEVRNLKRELILQQMIFMLLQNHGFMSEALNNIQILAETEAEPIKQAAAGLNTHRDFKERSFYFEQWESGVSNFLETIDQKIKPALKEFCLGIVDWLLQGNPYEFIFAFIYIIFWKLKDLQNSNQKMIAPAKEQMETLLEMLQFVLVIAQKTTNLDENLQTFWVYFQPWINIAAALCIVHWVDEKDEELFALVSPSLEKFNLSVLELSEAYIVVLKALKPSNVSEILLMREAVGRFTDIVLENLMVSTDDRYEMLRDGLRLWIALLMDPPQASTEDGKAICAQTNLLIGNAESLIRSLCLEKLGENIEDRRNILLNEFLENIKKVKAEVRQLLFEIPGLSRNNVPQTNRRGFFDFLMENLQKKLESEAEMFPFEKHLIAILHRELALLRSFLMDIFELQVKHKEIRDIWVQASNVAYLVDYVTDYCLSSIDVPIWSYLIHLSNAIEQVQFVKTEISNIRKNDQMYNNEVISAKVNSKLFLLGRQEANATTKDDVKVGFKDEERRIIDRLMAGEVGLDIVAIVGMPGQGKTTLAQRVFHNSCIELHFNKYAWCCISQAYDMKEIFLDILKSIGEPVSPEDFPYLSPEDLADRLRKRLKGQRYLVVLDDMWDAKAWYELQLSFPDDNNGSRILLTSRHHNVALEVKRDCCIVELHPLSYEESWNLLRLKVFEEDYCPRTLSDIGKMIAENCKGLPLAIVVVAGLLKKDKSADSWKQILGGLKSQIASEGCMNILDLSYKLLPDYLKPCFLYLGAFKEDQIIDAKRLIEYWIAEGFVQNNGRRSMEVVANEYLIDLVSRSLVTVAKRSSRNGIKKCRVHDLLHLLCLIKSEEERFLLVPYLSDHSSSIRYDHYRVCIHDKWGPFLDSLPIVPSVRSLLVSTRQYNRTSSAPGFLKRFKLIRVLDLSYAFVTRTDFDEITKLIHLRLLAVACRFSIPSSIANLSRLEVLSFRHAGAPVILPSAVTKMTNLRHIFATGSIEYIEGFDKMVPNLCPPLANLVTFTSLLFEDKLSFEWVVQKLPNILKLGLTLPFCIHLSSYFEKLESLNLYIPRSPHVPAVISPSILDFPLTLKKLNLKAERRLSGAMMSSIGKLSNLEVLKLHTHFEDGRWDVEDDEFLQLKYLEFRLSSIQEWSVSDESFPCLEQLVVKRCHELGELPDRFREISTLKRIVVRNCSSSISDSFQQIVDDQIDSGNEGLQFSIS